ncbi:acireductone synthase [Pirellulaceae bacterium SH449]
MVELKSVDIVLLDIEGTVSDVRFVYDVMFPFAKQNMKSFLACNVDSAEVRAAILQVATDAGSEPNHLNQRTGPSNTHSGIDIDRLDEHLQNLMAADSKSTGLKALQGLVWKSGFESGELRAELFPDVVPALNSWVSRGIRVHIYSSGSVLAQQLFFRFTTEGDLSNLLSGHFDTTVGKKQEPGSYQRISQQIGASPERILFVSDIAEELIAASSIGMKVVASVRPSNKPLPSDYAGERVDSFAEIRLA